MTHSRGVQHLADELGVEAEHVARAFRTASHAHAAIRAVKYTHLTDEQFRRLIDNDRYTIAVVANLAMRFAGRTEDARLLTDIYKAASGKTAHRPVIRRGVGTLRDHHDHDVVQQAIRILQAAGLPPIETDGTRALRDGFQVLPGCDELPGWVFIAPDPDCAHRGGFAGGRDGYPTVMKWAGWGVIPEPLAEGLFAAVHPDHRDQPFPS
ncbi:hypothetical protein K7472_08160 [Streptomyces sp. PTM05]|uniref:Uncharacterized protein n=1 Tax=Streptantibioticus parmotrematis TaxID=2873249 RepID=A0ABS7QSN3_9ACTN|nr:hypothetical protein [Streptantibioticus parmotrematis]MBY8884819.1 hypothetical protein [Streptantibioticus parmotrematis]